MVQKKVNQIFELKQKIGNYRTLPQHAFKFVKESAYRWSAAIFKVHDLNLPFQILYFFPFPYTLPCCHRLSSNKLSCSELMMTHLFMENNDPESWSSAPIYQSQWLQTTISGSIYLSHSYAHTHACLLRCKNSILHTKYMCNQYFHFLTTCWLCLTQLCELKAYYKVVNNEVDYRKREGMI